MAHRRRPTYSPEFKAEAVRLVRTSPDGLAKIARDLGDFRSDAAQLGGGKAAVRRRTADGG